VGKVVLRDKEHLVAIRPYQRELVMHVVHYLDDIRPADEIPELKEMQKVDLDNKEFVGKIIGREPVK
jgi:DNA end-binding protein Ku